jgi:hypothetical protein
MMNRLIIYIKCFIFFSFQVKYYSVEDFFAEFKDKQQFLKSLVSVVDQNSENENKAKHIIYSIENKGFDSVIEFYQMNQTEIIIFKENMLQLYKYYHRKNSDFNRIIKGNSKYIDWISILVNCKEENFSSPMTISYGGIINYKQYDFYSILSVILNMTEDLNSIEIMNNFEKFSEYNKKIILFSMIFSNNKKHTIFLYEQMKNNNLLKIQHQAFASLSCNILEFIESSINKNDKFYIDLIDEVVSLEKMFEKSNVNCDSNLRSIILTLQAIKKQYLKN